MSCPDHTNGLPPRSFLVTDCCYVKNDYLLYSISLVRTTEQMSYYIILRYMMLVPAHMWSFFQAVGGNDHWGKTVHHNSERTLSARNGQTLLARVVVGAVFSDPL